MIVAKKEHHRATAPAEKAEKEMPIRAYRVPVLLYSEFLIYVVRPDGRAESEIVRSLLAEAVRMAKEAMRQK